MKNNDTKWFIIYSIIFTFIFYVIGGIIFWNSNPYNWSIFNSDFGGIIFLIIIVFIFALSEYLVRKYK